MNSNKIVCKICEPEMMPDTYKCNGEDMKVSFVLWGNCERCKTKLSYEGYYDENGKLTIKD